MPQPVESKHYPNSPSGGGSSSDKAHDHNFDGSEFLKDYCLISLIN